METGRIEFFSGAKGWGFIKRKQGQDVFVHYSAILMDGYRTLNEGDVVEFELEQGKKGIQAANVRLIEKGGTNDKQA